MVFHYQPQIQDVLHRIVPARSVEAMLRRDNELEDYLKHLEASIPAGGGGTLSAKRDFYQGGSASPIASDPDLANVSTLDWVSSTPLDGGVTYSGGVFFADTAGLYTVSFIVGYDPDPSGIRFVQVGAGGDVLVSPMLAAVVPGNGANMLVGVSGAVWMAAGEWFNPAVAQDSGSALSVSGAITITQVISA